MIRPRGIFVRAAIQNRPAEAASPTHTLKTRAGRGGQFGAIRLHAIGKRGRRKKRNIFAGML